MQRIARLSGIDRTSGEFEMILATEGEASDGHILSVEGADLPASMPLLSSHYNDPTEALGSVSGMSKELRAKPRRILARGQIETGGEGAKADVRRDVVHMIDEGHIGAVSVRWNNDAKGTRRVNLPSDHPAHVASDDGDHPGRFGMFFHEWRALEGSIVALGADPEALIVRSQETEGEVSRFWRSMAVDVDPPEPAETAFLRALERCLEDGASIEDMLDRVVSREDHTFACVDIDGEPLYIPTRVAGLLRDATPEAPAPAPEPEAPADPPTQPYRMVPAHRIVDLFTQAVEEFEAKCEARDQAEIDRLRGRVS